MAEKHKNPLVILVPECEQKRSRSCCRVPRHLSNRGTYNYELNSAIISASTNSFLVLLRLGNGNVIITPPATPTNGQLQVNSFVLPEKSKLTSLIINAGSVDPNSQGTTWQILPFLEVWTPTPTFTQLTPNYVVQNFNSAVQPIQLSPTTPLTVLEAIYTDNHLLPVISQGTNLVLAFSFTTISTFVSPINFLLSVSLVFQSTSRR